jgi:hypothetical protein
MTRGASLFLAALALTLAAVADAAVAPACPVYLRTHALGDVPPVIRLLHAASSFANESMGVGARSAASTSAPSDYTDGLRALTRLNTWSSDTLMAECYAKANVWLRGFERSVERGGTSAEAGIMSVDIVSKTQMAVGLSRDLVKAQGVWEAVGRRAKAAAVARAKVTARLLIDLPLASRAVDAASSASPAAPSPAGGDAGAGSPSNGTAALTVAAASLGLMPQHTRALQGLLGSLDAAAAASALAVESLDEFASVMEAIWQRANVSIQMCAQRWTERQREEVVGGTARQAAATPHAHTVWPDEGRRGGGRRGRGGVVDDDDENEAAVGVDGGALELGLGADGEVRLAGGAERRPAPAPTAVPPGPTEPIQMLDHAEDALRAAEGIVNDAITGALPLACEVRSALLVAFPSLDVAAASGSGSGAVATSATSTMTTVSSSSSSASSTAAAAASAAASAYCAGVVRSGGSPLARAPWFADGAGGGGEGGCWPPSSSTGAAGRGACAPKGEEAEEPHTAQDVAVWWHGLVAAATTAPAGASSAASRAAARAAAAGKAPAAAAPPGAAAAELGPAELAAHCAGLPHNADMVTRKTLGQSYCASASAITARALAGAAAQPAAGSAGAATVTAGAGTGSGDSGCLGAGATTSLVTGTIERLRLAHTLNEKATLGAGGVGGAGAGGGRPVPGVRFGG